MKLDRDWVEQRCSEIRQVFSGVPKPEITKRLGRELDDAWGISQARHEQLSVLDTEENWWDISDADVEEFNEILSWVEPRGFLFYYPRYLTHALQNWGQRVDDTFDVALHHFGQFANLSIEQLEFVRELYAELALMEDPVPQHHADLGEQEYSEAIFQAHDWKQLDDLLAARLRRLRDTPWMA